MTDSSPQPALFVHQDAEAVGHDGATVRVLASAGQRTAARLLDYLCLVLVWTMPLLIVSAATVVTSDWNDIVIAILAAACGIAPFVGWFLLRIGRLVRWGCTVGQRIAGIRVVALDGVSSPTWGQAWKRFQPTWGGNSDAGLPTDDYFAWKGSRGRRASSGQCLHDKNAHTMVVLADDTPSERRHRQLLGAALAVIVLVSAAAWGWEALRDDHASTASVSSFDDPYETEQATRHNGHGT